MLWGIIVITDNGGYKTEEWASEPAVDDSLGFPITYNKTILFPTEREAIKVAGSWRAMSRRNKVEYEPRKMI